MKKALLFILSVLVAVSVSAQDLLVKRSGEKMRVKVLKITKSKVQFVRQGTELPVYTLPISEIDYIEYPTGDRDTFGRAAQVTQPEKKEPVKWHGAVPPHNGAAAKTPTLTPAPTQSQNVGEKSGYNIGDIYDQNGVKGVVMVLYENGLHGLVMSLDEVCLAWTKLPRKMQKKSTGATDCNDGRVNMQAVERYIAENNLSWSDFPAFEWCRNKGEGWYLPAINEIWSAGTMYLGGSRTISNRRYRKDINDAIEAAGGTPISGIMIYQSSTEDSDPLCSKFTHMNTEPPFIQSGFKGDKLFVRAFHRF